MQSADITQFLQQHRLFSALSDTALARLSSQFSAVSFKLGDTVVSSGDPGEAWYLVYAGRARVVDETTPETPVTVTTLAPGDTFGEQALLAGGPVAQTVRASGALTLLRLAGSDFDQLVSTFPELRKALEEQVRQYVELHFLRTLPIFSTLTPKETQELLPTFETVHLSAGAFLFHEGEAGDAAYIVRTGSLRVIQESAGNALLVVWQSGAVIGEMALLFNQPRSAGVVAASETVLLRLPRETFTQMTARWPRLRELLTKDATNRLLRGETIIASGATLPRAQTPRHTLHTAQVSIGTGLGARTYPVVQTDTPLLAGIACVATINRAYRRQDTLHQAMEQQLLAGQPDTLSSVSQKAEAEGYLTRLLRLPGVQLGLVQCPAIVEEADGQLEVLLAVSRRCVVLADPCTGVRQVPRQTFAETWHGQVLTVSYVPNFGAVGRQTTQLLRQFWPLVRPYRHLLMAFGLVSLTLQILGLVGPLFSQVIIDKVIVYHDTALLWLMLCGMLLTTAFQLIGSTLREFLLAHTLRRVNAFLLLRFFHHVLSLPQQTFSKWRVGDFLLRFYENEKLLQLVSQNGFQILIDSLSVLLYVGVLFGKHATLTLVGLLFVGAAGLLMLITTPLLRAADRRIFARREAMTSHLVAAVTGIDTIQAMAAEQCFGQHGINLIVQSKRAELQGALLSFNIGLISTLLRQASMLGILGYGAMLVLRGELTVGELVAFNATLGLLMAPLMGLIGIWNEVQAIQISFERINDVLSLSSEAQDVTALLPELHGHVHLEQVSFRYEGSDRDVLSDITLEVSPGQKVAVVGRSGSGKTTLVNLLMRLYEPTRGRVLLDHRDISNCELSSLRHQVGMVEQQPFLFNDTIAANIAKGDPTATLERVVAAATLAGAHAFIDALPMGYDTQIGERGMTLSGGQKQRLAIARTILPNPRLLILDEATSALDTESERLVQQNLDALMAGRTTFIIAHRLSTVRNADVIVVLDAGRLVEMGTHEQLLAQQGLYAYLYSKAPGE